MSFSTNSSRPASYGRRRSIQLRASDSFVVFLSEDSIRSDMVRQEVKIAHELLQEGKMAIFPVRLGFKGKLPYDLASWLDPIQYVLWKPGDPAEELFALLHAAIRENTELPGDPPSDDPAVISLTDPTVVAERKGAPLPAADPRIVMETGTIRLDSPFYVRRREDEIIARYLAGRGETILISGPGQVGKSSLLARAHALARKGGLGSVFLDFQKDFDEIHIENLRSTLQTLAQRIARSLKIPVQLADVWDFDLGEKGSFEDFLSAVLERSSAPLVLILDQVDRLIDRRYCGDFFAAIRGWHNKRATEEAWENLYLILGHTTDPALWIVNQHESPFNIGDRLRLGDFTLEEVKDLNARHGNPLRGDEVAGLMDLVGGHPYLVRQALYFLAAERWSLVRLREEAVKDNGPFGEHLRRHLWSLLPNERLLAMVARITKGGGCDDQRNFLRLVASGLVAGETRSAARLRCKLYQQYFSLHLP